MFVLKLKEISQIPDNVSKKWIRTTEKNDGCDDACAKADTTAELSALNLKKHILNLRFN